MQGNLLPCEPGPFLLPSPSARGAALARCGMISWCPELLSCALEVTRPCQDHNKRTKSPCGDPNTRNHPDLGVSRAKAKGSEGDWECSLGRGALRIGKRMDWSGRSQKAGRWDCAQERLCPGAAKFSQNLKKNAGGSISFNISCSEQNPFAIAQGL